MKNKIRTDANAQGDYGEQDNDSRLEENMGFRTPNGLERARTPTLVVVGEREEGDAPLGLRIVAVLPNAPGRLAKGVGHNWSLEAPELFTRMVKASINDEPLPSKLLSSGEY